MDDTHAASEEDEGEEGKIPHTQSPPINHSITYNLALDQDVRPALIKAEPRLELTTVALHQPLCSSLTLSKGSVDLTKPNGANMTTGLYSELKSAFKRTTMASDSQRTIIAANPNDCFENEPQTPPGDLSVPLKKIKLEEPWVWTTEQATNQLRDEDAFCEDPLSTLAAVVCLSVTERKGLEEKLQFGSRTSIIRSIKTEPPDLHLVKKEPEDLKNDLCQKRTPVCLLKTPQHVKSEPPASVLLPSVQSLAERRNLSFEQAIAIEALTQLAAIPQSTQRPVEAGSKYEHRVSNAARTSTSKTNTAQQEAKHTAAISYNKVSVISSPLGQMSVIRPPVARQGNVIQCSQGSSSNAKLSQLLLTEPPSSSYKTPCRRTEHGFNSQVIKSECSYKDSSGMKLSKTHERSFVEDRDRVVDKMRRNRDEEEVAAQLADLAFIIQSRHSQHSENNPPKGTPVSAIKYNYNSSQKKTQIRKNKTTPSKPRKKKVNDGLCEEAGRRTPFSKRMPNGGALHKGRGQKIVQPGKSSLQTKKSLFLPQAQIDIKQYLVEGQEERRQLSYHSNAHNSHSYSDITRITHPCVQENQPWSFSNVPLHQHNPCNGHAAGAGQACESHLLSQVTQPSSGLQHGADADTSPASFLSHTTGRHGLTNGFSGARQSPPPSEQNYYKLERSGPVTVLSTATDGDLGHSAETTPTKININSFLESPMSFLDTPIKNILNTPSKKLAEPPSCQCIGELLLYHSLFHFSLCGLIYQGITAVFLP